MEKIYKNGFIEWQKGKKIFVKCNRHLTWNTVGVSEYLSHFTIDWLEGGTANYVLRIDNETIQIFSQNQNDTIFAMGYDKDTHTPEIYMTFKDEELKTNLEIMLEIIKHPTGVQTMEININEN